MLDAFDPNILFNQPPHECRIYGDNMAQTWAVVSPHHYQECIKHRWRYKPSRERNNGKRTKKYLARNVHVNWNNGGPSKLNRTQENYFLHEFILVELMGKPKPSPKHVVDHRDGDEDNCTEENLRWATKVLNGLNKNGSHAGKEHDDVGHTV